jgi:hypothetical protein
MRAGVPPIEPVLLLRVKPAGNAGFTVNAATAPPLTIGVFAVIAVPIVYVAVTVT